MNEQAGPVRYTCRRLKVILPCAGAILLLAIGVMPQGTSIRMRPEIWLSFISGPLACWIEISWHYEPKEKVRYTLLALVLALGMLSDPLRANTMTAVITILASCLWLFMGVFLTYAGWG